MSVARHGEDVDEVIEDRQCFRHPDAQVEEFPFIVDEHLVAPAIRNLDHYHMRLLVGELEAVDKSMEAREKLAAMSEGDEY